MKTLSPRHSSGKAKPSKNGEVNTVTVQISREDKYILTVGFEVNYPEAFHNNVLNLSVDFGHAFFMSPDAQPCLTTISLIHFSVLVRQNSARVER